MLDGQFIALLVSTQPLATGARLCTHALVRDNLAETVSFIPCVTPSLPLAAEVSIAVDLS
jgi:hypothetical protein